MKFLRILTLALAGCLPVAHALTPEQAAAIASGETDARIEALNQAAAAGDAQLPGFVRALLDGEVKVLDGRVFQMQGDKVVVAGTAQAVELPEAAEDVVNNNRMRGALEAALGALKLVSPDAKVRAEAVEELRKQSLDEAQMPLIEKAWAAESDAGLKSRLALMRATILVSSSDVARRLAAAQALSASSEPAVKSLLQERLAPGVETDPAVRGALMTALDAVEGRLAWGSVMAPSI